jgi:hypothetical protein
MPKKRRYYKGKRVSKGEKRIIEFLNTHNIKFELEKTFPDCLGRTGRKPLRFDFFLLDYNILIEYDGEHHYKPVNKGYRAKYVHERTVINDKIKDNYIKEKGVGLLRIPYWEYDQIDEILTEVIGL